MNLEQWFNKKMKAFEKEADYRLESVLLDVLETVCRVMKEEKVTQAELARRLGTSRSFITKLLNGHPNMTVQTLFKVAEALNRDVKVNFTPRGYEVRTFYTSIPRIPKESLKEYSFEKIITASEGTIEEPSAA